MRDKPPKETRSKGRFVPFETEDERKARHDRTEHVSIQFFSCSAPRCASKAGARALRKRCVARASKSDGSEHVSGRRGSEEKRQGEGRGDALERSTEVPPFRRKGSIETDACDVDASSEDRRLGTDRSNPERRVKFHDWSRGEDWERERRRTWAGKELTKKYATRPHSCQK